MFVIGTAGHVDHGKSTLIHALTGIDPDRLAEEKVRGMTIDLGFAWLKLPGGREVSIVDVPGHERFIKNMLAGVGGIDIALLVVAADESVMPQTREHLAILDLLRMQRGIVVVTKKDLVDSELLELVKLEVEEVLQGTSLKGSPIVAISAVTKEGLPELIQTIGKILDSTPPKKDTGRPRLPVDRVFSITGFGTVVTGTLIDGKLAVGQEVEILPRGLKSHIRGLQTHKQKEETAYPGSRVAANLAGLSADELKRGDVVASPGWLKITDALDARIRLLSDLRQPLKHNTPVGFHCHTAEIAGKVRLLDKEQLNPGETGWVQIVLVEKTPLVKGDLFIIRSPNETLGGGEVVDIDVKRHRRFSASTIEGLAAREKGTPEEIILTTLRIKEPLEASALMSTCNLARGEFDKTLAGLVERGHVIALGNIGPKVLLFSAEGWQKLTDRVKSSLQGYHSQFSLRRGMPREELRSKINLPGAPFQVALQKLVQAGVVAEDGSLVRLAGFQVKLNAEQDKTAGRFLKLLAENPYSPPSDRTPDDELMGYLIDKKLVVKVTADVIFSAPAYQDMVGKITGFIKSKGKITVGEVRDLFQTSRKYALALMEYLDEQKITRRVGDERVLR